MLYLSSLLPRLGFVKKKLKWRKVTYHANVGAACLDLSKYSHNSSDKCGTTTSRWQYQDVTPQELVMTPQEAPRHFSVNPSAPHCLQPEAGGLRQASQWPCAAQTWAMCGVMLLVEAPPHSNPQTQTHMDPIIYEISLIVVIGRTIHMHNKPLINISSSRLEVIWI